MAAQIQLDPDRFDRPKGARELMRDGAWLVPPKDRPKGWERMGLEEPKEAMPTLPVIKLQESAQSSTLRQYPVDWECVISRALAIPNGQSEVFDVPSSENRARFAQNLGNRLRNGHPTFEWSVCALGGSGTPLSETKIVVSRKLKVSTLPTATKRRVEETQTTTVHRAITETVEERAPKPLPNAVRELLVGAPTAELAVRKAPSEIMQRATEPGRDRTLSEIAAAVLRTYGPDEQTDEEYEGTFEKMEDLAYQLYAERHADIEAASYANLIADANPGSIHDDAWEMFYNLIHELSVEKRLAQLALMDACKRLHRGRDNDELFADRLALRLPEEDQKRIEKVKAQIKKEDARKAKAAVSSNSGSTPK